MADFNGQIFPPLPELIGAAFQTPRWFAQRVWSSGWGAWCYYVKPVVDPAPLAIETTPNWTGAISGHEVLGIYYGVAPIPALITPIGIFGSLLESWLRADMGISLVGSDVGAWADQSIEVRDYGQGTAARRPSMGTINGKPAVNFDYTNQEYLSLTGPAYGAPAAGQVIRVMQRNADPPPAAAATGLDTMGPVGDGAYPWVAPGVIYDTTLATVAGTFATVGNPATSMALPCIYESIATAAKFEARLNGTVLYSGAPLGVTFAATPNIGGNVAAARYMNGLIGEHIVLSGEATALMRAQYAMYVLAYWGMVTT
jgi:hypothetical protein